MWGVGIGQPHRNPDGTWQTLQQQYRHFIAARRELLSDDAAKQFLRSLAFLSRVKPTTTIRPGTGSYWLKHIAENYICSYPDGQELGPDYVSNGALIAAAVHKGFKIKTYLDDQGYEHSDACFNMSKRALNDLDREIRPRGCLRARSHGPIGGHVLSTDPGTRSAQIAFAAELRGTARPRRRVLFALV